ncbi:sulfotransferase domain-containing protein [Rhizobium sp. KVB221]|uniref:Sulfotransferase domain-containing protein n=1 Tax=Rhizobium setariae TaxID=2801340 RepID=A0A936YJN5_9HYPH|nr:sulfotransferase domain-containing protein [Rhizobium setariae]MBL0370818.1 sulfotransferase domain-containing protein [Rhizobium setariae]
MFVLHVGPHKTATTWLQQNFHHNIKALEKAGWLYPQTGERVRVAHHDLSDDPDETLDGKSRRFRELQAIARKANDRGLNILLSSEGFRNWKPEHLLRLKEIMAPHEMRIVYCVRDPVSTFYSFWAQQVKTGSKLSFPEFCQKQFRKPIRSRLLNPLVEIDALAELEDVDLTLLLYDEIRRRNDDIFDVFVQSILGIGPLPHVDAETANERQPLEMTEFMRLILLRVGSWRDEADTNIGRVFHHMLGERTREQIVSSVGAVSEARQNMTIDREQPVFRRAERQLLARYKASMIPSPAKRLFLEGAQECAFYDAEKLQADPTVRQLLDDVVRKVRPGGLRMWVMGWSRFWLMLWRRIVKAVRL